MNNSGDHITHWIHNGILIFVNLGPILWHSKRQATIKSSTFGSKVIALRTVLYIFKGLQYKLRMMGVNINGTSYMFGYNMSLVNSASIP